ncbi:ATP-dependent DNA helicase [Cellulomonas rhizosphaerae]|uniref:DNA 3'-5' helicase n=1 Tax=Cellulomonas rhizosphaerae TaxID=2293719 RepID=A0A413RQ92_9CELL|nr:ATP-dependent DNA helicase [Cellulomonas rhizosphaerae]RHA44078.1 ATP-dependent helicase [Cellulomonas rhizosphaerae]
MSAQPERLSAVRIAELTDQPRPTVEQERIIEAPLLPALVVAGAGSGKTETMAARVVWLLANGLVAPDQVLGLTFTRKAAGELGERVRRRVRLLVRCAAAAGVELPGREAMGVGGLLDGLARPTISTYNAYAASLVSDHALRLGLDPSARLLGEAAQWQLASEVVEAWDDDLGTDSALSTVVEAVLTLSGALDEHLLDPVAARSGIETIAEALLATPAGTPPRAPYADIARLLGSLSERARLLDVVARYRDRKRAADAIDFGDQVALAARLARDVPEVGVAERDRFRVVLLDEYQDTSYAQLTLLSALFGGGHAVTAVGDPHQSIYGWRGASAGGLEGFPTTFPIVSPDGRRPADVHQLSTSWRNDAAVLDAANHVAGPLRSAASLVEVPLLATRPGAGDGRVLAHVAETIEDEARTVAEFVAERWRPVTRDGKRVTAAVLCRKRSQFEPLRRALRAQGLPVEVVGLGGLLSAPEVVDLLAALQAAHDPTRGDALMRLLTGARTRLGAADLHALGAWSAELAGRHGGRAREAGVEADSVDERSIVDALDDLPRPGWRSASGRSLSDTGRSRLTDLAGLLRTLRAHAYLAVPELVAEAERVLGLDIEVAARAGVSPGTARAQLDAFRDVAIEFARTSDHPTLGGFLAWLEAADARENGLEMPVTEPNPDAVQIITIHAAKGLEWDVVAVAGLVDGGLPATATQGKDGPKDSAWLVGLGNLPYPLRGDRAHLPAFAYEGAADPKDLEERRRRFVLDAGDHEVAEERRLAYVALTRARTDLLLTAAWWGDGTRARRVSTFLTELAEAGLVETATWAGAPEEAAQNPRAGVVVTATWPADPFATEDGSAGRRPALERAAQWVRDARAADAHVSVPDVPDEPAHPWAALADRLLAERSRARATTRDVELPSHLSASALVRLGADPDEFSRALRRPIPQEPSAQARLGTRFHAWVEGYFGSAALVDVDALPGADDVRDELDTSAPGLDGDIDVLRRAFLAGEWADRVPVAIEVDVETSVDGYVLRSRIDAVFADPRPGDRGSDPIGSSNRGAADGPRVVVVDWKTGAPPTDPQVRAAREIQLAVYRLAWSRWTGLPLEAVSAAFSYVGAGVTVYPDRLLGEAEIVALLRTATDATGPADAPSNPRRVNGNPRSPGRGQESARDRSGR